MAAQAFGISNLLSKHMTLRAVLKSLQVSMVFREFSGRDLRSCLYSKNKEDQSCKNNPTMIHFKDDRRAYLMFSEPVKQKLPEYLQDEWQLIFPNDILLPKHGLCWLQWRLSYKALLHYPENDLKPTWLRFLPLQSCSWQIEYGTNQAALPNR